MSVQEALLNLQNELEGTNCKLIAVTKTHPAARIMEAYRAGYKRYGENKVQELVSKAELLPKDIEWHLIGHLQSNKVKYIAPFITLIHSVDSFSLLQEIDKQAAKNDRVIDCLLQIHIASEETKFGLNFGEATGILHNPELDNLAYINITGLMGMATHTTDEKQIREEFRSLRQFFDSVKSIQKNNVHIAELSMGMSSDYAIAIQEGSTYVRVGSKIFGQR